MERGSAIAGRDELVGTGAHLSVVELRAWTRFLDSSRMLEEVLADHLVADHAMSHSEYEILVRLDGDGGHMRMSVLAARVVASPSRLSYTIDQLQQRGWVERRPAADDGRGVEAWLTGPGRRALADAAPEHAELIRRYLLSRMSPAELRTVGDALDRVVDGLLRRRS